MNVVLSSRAKGEGEGRGAVWCGSLEEAMRVLEGMSVDDDDDVEEGAVKVGRVFIIGGRAVYKAALERPETKRVLLTRVYGDWDCDVFFPADIEHEKGWERKGLKEFRDWVGEEVPEGRVKEGEVEFEYCMFERD